MKVVSAFILAALTLVNSGCLPLIVGGTAGALGAVAVSRDTIQGETDRHYDRLWESAYQVAKIRGIIREEDKLHGYLRVDVALTRVEIRLIRLTQATTRLRITARKYHLPDLGLAEELFVKIMEEPR